MTGDDGRYAMRDERGFTLTEILIAMAVAAIVAGTAYVLLDAGLSMHERGADVGVSNAGMAGALAILRADVARAASVAHASGDSLVLSLPWGEAVEWVARDRSDGLAVYRSVDTGGGFSERPKRPVVVLLDGPGVPASLDFSELVSGVVRARFGGDSRTVTLDAAPWSLR